MIKYAVSCVIILIVLAALVSSGQRSRWGTTTEEEEEEPRKTLIVVKELQLPPETPQISEEPVQEELQADAPIDGGRLIAMQADYRRHLGFPAYIVAMKRRGARFFVYEAGKDKLVAEVDLPQGIFSRIDPASLAGLSPRVREISGEIAISPLLDRARRELGRGYHKVIMLLPLSVEQRLDLSIRQRLLAVGQDPNQVSQIEGEYLARNGQLCFSTESYSTKNGRHGWSATIPF